MSRYATLLDSCDPDEESASQLALTDEGVELPSDFVGTTGFVRVVTPTALRTVFAPEPGLSRVARLLWRYPMALSDSASRRLDDGQILLGTRIADLRRYDVVDQRSADAVGDLPLHTAQSRVDDCVTYDCLLRTLGLQIQAVKATLRQTAWVPEETRQAIQSECETLHRLRGQQQVVLPRSRLSIHDHDLWWNEQLSGLGTVGDHIRALKETLWMATEFIDQDDTFPVSVARTLSDLLLVSQERCLHAHHRWLTLIERDSQHSDDERQETVERWETQSEPFPESSCPEQDAIDD